MSKKDNKLQKDSLGGPCFIATASYGTPLAPQLDVLRRFRDTYLPRLFIQFYYATSPPIASFIQKKDTVRRVIRGYLEPIVRLQRRLLYES